MTRMHYVMYGVGFCRDVLEAANAILVADRLRKVPELSRRLAVRVWWLHRGNPDFILMPPGRDWPAGLGYRVPARLGDPFTGASWLVR